MSEGSKVPPEGMGQHNPAPREGTLLCSCNQRAEDQGIAMSLSTPETIRTLQRKLYTKAKQEPAFRFYALYDKCYRADILSHAYARVRSNQGAPGIDGVTCETIEAGEGKAQFLSQLGAQLTVQAPDDGRLESSACPVKKNIGKPCTGKPYARFDEGGQANVTRVQLVRHRQAKAAATDRLQPKVTVTRSLLYLFSLLAH